MYITMGIIAGFLLLAIIASLICYLIPFYTDRKHHFPLYHDLDGELDEGRRRCKELIDTFIEIPYEDVYIKSLDGLELHARYYHTSDGAPVWIQCHGYKSCAERDMSGIGKEALNMGHNLLLTDHRAHGKSEGRTISFGIKERYDVKLWAEYISKRFGEDTKIILAGISMGAATVLMASELELPRGVSAVLADCPYSSPSDIIKKVARDMHLPAALIYPFLLIGARVFGGFGLREASPREAVKRTDIPILLVHGTGDDFVPCTMSDEIAEAGKTITYIKVEGAKHGLSFIKDYETYMNVLKEFLNKAVNNYENQ